MQGSHLFCCFLHCLIPILSYIHIVAEDDPFGQSTTTMNGRTDKRTDGRTKIQIDEQTDGRTKCHCTYIVKCVHYTDY